MSALHIETTDSQLAGLWSVYHAKRRKNSSTAAVDPEALGALLRDHHSLFTAATSRPPRGNGHKVDADRDQESLR